MLEQLAGTLGNELGRKVQLLVDLLKWRRGAEAIDANDIPCLPHPALPSQRRGSFDRQPNGDRGRQHLISIRLRLLREQLP